FFTLSEHIVFAIRALPIAIAAVVLLVVGLTVPRLINRRWQLVMASFVSTVVWPILLLLVAVYVAVLHHYLLFATVLLLAIAAFVRRWTFSAREPLANILYGSITLIALSFAAGFASQKVWWTDSAPFIENRDSPTKSDHARVRNFLRQ